MIREQALIKIGLTKNEAEVYLVLLDKGKLSISILQEITKIKKGNLYNIVYALRDKKLIEEIIADKKYYRVLNPNKLNNYLQTQKQALLEAQNIADNLLPELLTNFRLANDKPGVYYYEGIDGLEKIYDLIIKEKNDLFLFVSKYEKTNKDVEALIRKQVSRQFKAGIKVYALSGRHYTKEEIEIRTKRNAYVKTISDFSVDADIIIFGDNVAITTFKNKIITTLIINNNIAQTMKMIFDSLWDRAIDPSDYIKIKI